MCDCTRERMKRCSGTKVAPATCFILLFFLADVTYAGWDFCPVGSQSPCSASNQCCGPSLVKSGQGSPSYHFRDATCGINDPNGPFFDPLHGLYHLFYQDHIGLSVPKTFPQGFEGPSWGHGVSPDLVHWTNLPVALWNGDAWYDIHALFTGSATIVNGTTPVLMFPGVCDLYPPSGYPGCRYGYTFGVATPTSHVDDPLLTNWTKSDFNPIVNDTFDDPSTAWITSSGELRWIANCGDGVVGDCGPNKNQAPLFGASDSTFRDAYKIGFTNLNAGECPSLYPLPPLSPGTKPTSEMPTHVHKWGCEPYKDCVEIGRWHEGSTDKHEVGTWTSQTRKRVIDQGCAYAAKDFNDTKRNRRISFAWARLNQSAQGSQINGDVQTLAREVTYHPTLHQLLFFPVKEQSLLRGGVLGEVQNESVSITRQLILGPYEHGNQSDITIYVDIPTEPATLYISITAAVRIKFYIDFSKRFTTDFDHDRTNGAEFYEVEVGMLTEDPYPSIKDSLALLQSDKFLELRLLLDHTITEAYWQNGRVAMTVPTPLTNVTSIALSTDTPEVQFRIDSVKVWEMHSAWITKERTLNMAASIDN